MGKKNENNLEEKHYTPQFLMEHMLKVLKEFGPEPTSFLENSAGDGRLIDFLKLEYPGIEVNAFDLINETHREDIKECNYLKEKIEYVPGRVAFINPPFTKAIKFIYKALEECDYCVSITGQNTFLNLDYDKYEVDTIDLFKNTRCFDDVKGNLSITIIAIKKKK